MSEEKQSPTQTIIIGIIMMLGSGFLWWYFNDFEQSGDASRRMNAIIAILYNIGGKWVASVVFFLIGLGVTWMGIKSRNEP